MHADAIERIAGRAFESLTRAPVDPHAVLFLLRRFELTRDAPLLDSLVAALDDALDGDVENVPAQEAAAWLGLFADAARVFDDSRLRLRADGLARALRDGWNRLKMPVGDRMLSLDACMRASPLVDRDLVAASVDELERVVGAVYTPGAGVSHTPEDPRAVRGELADQVRTASALVTAYEITERLPYSMLAEELMQTARRTLWDDGGGGFFAGLGDGSKPFVLNCEASSVLCRLASLHEAQDYRDAAVVAADADYGRDAQRTIDALPTDPDLDLALAVRYGLALTEWLAIKSAP